MDESPLDVMLRDYDWELDEAYIYASWRNSAFYSSEKKHEITNPKHYFSEKSKHIKEILKIAYIRIACFKTTPNVIVGYSVIRGTHLDFVYVKSPCRNSKIATMLIPKDIKTVTKELTDIGKIIVKKKNLKIGE